MHFVYGEVDFAIEGELYDWFVVDVQGQQEGVSGKLFMTL